MFVKDIRSEIFKEKMIILPALMFIVMNIVSYNLVSEISATTYVMLMQLKLPATCIISYLTLQKKFTNQKIFSVFLVCICSINICNEKQVTKHYITITNIIFALSEVILSSICSIYLQKIFREKQTIWIRNVELCIFSIPFYIFIIFHSENTFVTTRTGLLFSLLASCGGILVALSLLYCGAVGKTLVSSASLVMVTTVEHILYQTIPKFYLITFYIISTTSLIYYNHDIFEFDESKVAVSRPLLGEESNT
tara:strand:+ start:1712 stop:2464 length:753 start_codon:yes stop_codon:yes gene_type:complete